MPQSCLLMMMMMIWLGSLGVLAVKDEVHEGKVVSVLATEIVVLDSQDSENDKFLVNGETKIIRDGKPAKLSEIAVGDVAKVAAVLIEGKLIAKTITARSAE